MLQPGDVVWIREQLIDRPEEAIDPDDAVYIDWGGTPMWAEPRFVMPDVPNLAHIARFLAEHPETVDALEKQMHQSFGISGETKSSQLAVGFLKAMRGEGGHDAG